MHKLLAAAERKLVRIFKSKPKVTKMQISNELEADEIQIIYWVPIKCRPDLVNSPNLSKY